MTAISKLFTKSQHKDKNEHFQMECSVQFFETRTISGVIVIEVFRGKIPKIQISLKKHTSGKTENQ